MATRLRNLRVDFGSLVDKGAGEDVRVCLFKRDETFSDQVTKATDVARPFLKAAAARLDAITKDTGDAPQTFDQVNDYSAVRDEMWAVWDRFRTSACSILESSVTDKAALLKQSADEFNVYLDAAAPQWAAGQTVEKGDQMPTKATTAPAKPADAVLKALAPEVRAYLESLEKAAPAADAGKEGLVTKADHDAAIAAKDAEITTLKAKADPAAAEDDVLKSLPPAVRKRIEDAEQAAKDAGDVAKAERDQRVTREFIEKARALDVLPVAADVLGPILKRAADNALTDADRTEIDRVLKAANALIQKGNALREIGRAGAGDGQSATDRVNTLAQTMVTEKKAADYGSAITQIMKSAEHADLVREYQAESGRRN